MMEFGIGDGLPAAGRGIRGWGMGWELSCRKIAKKFIRYLMASKRERKFRIMNYELRIMSFSK